MFKLYSPLWRSLENEQYGSINEESRIVTAQLS